MANKTKTILGTTLCAAALLGAAQVLPASVPVLGTTVVRADENGEDVVLHATAISYIGHKIDEPFEYLKRDFFYLKPGESITTTAPEFEGYTLEFISVFDKNEEIGHPETFPVTVRYEDASPLDGRVDVIYDYVLTEDLIKEGRLEEVLKKQPKERVEEQPKEEPKEEPKEDEVHTVEIQYATGGPHDDFSKLQETEIYSLRPGETVVSTPKEFDGYTLLGLTVVDSKDTHGYIAEKVPSSLTISYDDAINHPGFLDHGKILYYYTYKKNVADSGNQGEETKEEPKEGPKDASKDTPKEQPQEGSQGGTKDTPKETPAGQGGDQSKEPLPVPHSSGQTGQQQTSQPAAKSPVSGTPSRQQTADKSSSQSVTQAPTTSQTTAKGLPATGDRSTAALTVMGLGLVLASLGLKMTRRQTL